MIAILTDYMIYIKTMLLVAFLVSASAYDVETRKIPNRLVLAGLIVGALTNATSLKSFFLAFIPVIILFLLAICGLMFILGSGDIKVLMVMFLFTGVTETLMSLFIACVLFIIFSLIKNKNAAAIMLSKLPLIGKTENADINAAYPFCPFLLSGYMIYLGVMAFEALI